MKQNRVIALDVGANTLKLAEFNVLKNDALELSAYSTAELGLDPQSDEARGPYLADAITDLIHATGIKPGPVKVSVSGQSVFSRYVKLPDVDPEKIDQIVQYEAAQNVPFPIDEVVWDYQQLDSTEDGLEVLIVAIKTEVLEEVTDAVLDSGLATELVDVAPMAIYNSAFFNYQASLGEECTLVLDMGSRSTNLIFIEGGRVFSRSIPVAGNAITQLVMKDFDVEYADAEALKYEHAQVAFGGAYEPLEDEDKERISKAVRSVMTRMHAEINRSLNFYRGQQGGSPPVRVLLTGGTSIIPHVDTFLNEKLGVEVEYLNPFQEVYVGSAIDTDQVALDAHMLSETVGLALRACEAAKIELDLMPPEILAGKEFEKKTPMFILAGVFLVLTCALWALFMQGRAVDASDELRLAKQQEQKLRGIGSDINRATDAIKKEEAVLEEITDLLDQRKVFVEVTEALRSVVPEGAWITSFATEIPEKPKTSSRSSSSSRRSDDDEPPALPPAKFQLQGLGYQDVVDGQVVKDLAGNLKELDAFSDARVVQLPLPKRKDILSFWVEVTLRDPLPE